MSTETGPNRRISVGQIRSRLPLVLGITLIVASLFLMLIAGTFADCETLTIGTSICFLYWFNYPLQITIIALGGLLAFTNRFEKLKALLSSFGVGVLLTYTSAFVPFREYSMILDSGNYPCHVLEYGYPLPWLTRIVTCITTGSTTDQLIIPASRFGLDVLVWTLIVGFIFLATKSKKLGKLTTVLICATALLGLLSVLLVLGTFG
ncbi:MAG TPA: hypothetical protein VEH56_08215 [Candidatus Saccharimonadales bacterium]|nr:hypothetical protein [Candidatus Saccharimonadales bacterium]